MIYPLVRELAAPDAPVRVSVTVTCRVLGFSMQGYYKWRARPCSDRDYADAQLINAAVDVHADDPGFGYRFIADELDQVVSRLVRTGCSGCVPNSGSGRCTPRNVA